MWKLEGKLHCLKYNVPSERRSRAWDGFFRIAIAKAKKCKTVIETNTKHMGASNLASMATERLQPFVPTTCPRWVSISILSNQSFCLNSLYQKAKHIAGFTRAPVKAFYRSRLTIRLGQFALNSQVKLAGPKAAANRFREQQVGENSPVPELSQCDSIFATSKSVPAGVGEVFGLHFSQQFPSSKLACKTFPT